jgi:hypothetical protein
MDQEQMPTMDQEQMPTMDQERMPTMDQERMPTMDQEQTTTGLGPCHGALLAPRSTLLSVLVECC